VVDCASGLANSDITNLASSRDWFYLDGQAEINIDRSCTEPAVGVTFS